MTQTESPGAAAAPGRRMTIPWQRMAGLRRRLMQTIFALAPLVLLAIGVHPAIAALPAIYPFFILIRRGYRRLKKKVTRTSRARELNPMPALRTYIYVRMYYRYLHTVSLAACRYERRRLDRRRKSERIPAHSVGGDESS